MLCLWCNKFHDSPCEKNPEHREGAEIVPAGSGYHNDEDSRKDDE